MAEDLQQDSLQRLNGWVEKLESQVSRLIDACQPEDLETAQAASLAVKCITLLARLLELRQQFTNDSSSDEGRLLKIIFGEQDNLELDR